MTEAILWAGPADRSASQGLDRSRARPGRRWAVAQMPLEWPAETGGGRGVSEYDAIVVGGGPGGSTAAYHLARAGAKVVVLDRKQFPRAKVCGDGLTPRAVGMLRDMGLEDQIAGYHRASGLRVFAGRRSMVLDFPQTSRWDDFGLVRPRKDLDWTIAQRAMEAGAEYRMMTEAVSPVLDRGS